MGISGTTTQSIIGKEINAAVAAQIETPMGETSHLINMHTYYYIQATFTKHSQISSEEK
jgi:hypothetical protein